MIFILQNWWWMLALLVIAVIAIAWFVMSSGYVHRGLDWLRPDSDKHIRAKMFCEDKQIRDRKLKIDRYCISDYKKMRSFHLIHDLLITKAGSSKQFLALTERGTIPIDFQGVMTKDKLAKYPSSQKVFIDTTADIRSNASRESANNMMAMSVSVIAMAVALIFLIMAIFMFWGDKA